MISLHSCGGHVPCNSLYCPWIRGLGIDWRDLEPARGSIYLGLLDCRPRCFNRSITLWVFDGFECTWRLSLVTDGMQVPTRYSAGNVEA